MIRIVLIQPGATDFDEQGRIKGSLDLPLSRTGIEQAEQTARELAETKFAAIYAAPCQSAIQTAELIAKGRKLRFKTLDKLRNLDHGLWHGKRIAEVREKQPKVYRQCQDYPDMVCPPDGESVASATVRAQSVLAKILKRHKDKDKTQCIALVVPQPFATIVRSQLQRQTLEAFWSVEQDCGHWVTIDLAEDPRTVLVS